MGVIWIHESDFMISEPVKIQPYAVPIPEHRESLIKLAEHRKKGSANRWKSKLLVVGADQQIICTASPLHEVGTKGKTIERGL